MLGNLLPRRDAPTVDLDRSQLSFNQYLKLVEPFLPFFTQQPSLTEKVERTVHGVAAGAYSGNAIVFACAAVRLQVFSEVRFQWRNVTTNRMYGNTDLALLERPWQGGTTRDLLARMEQDATTAGNSFWYNAGSLVRADGRGSLVRLRPEHCTLMLEDVLGPTGRRIGRQVVALAYAEPNDDQAEVLELGEFVHYAPIPDPVASWRGMSWLSTVLDDVNVDNALTAHKHAFITNAATPNMVVTLDASVPADALEQIKASVDAGHAGPTRSGKTLYLGGGADVKVVGSNFEQLAIKAVQGHGESRVAAAAGVGAVIANLSEGMQGSSLNAGNYAAARRRFADGTMRPLWGSAAAALSVVLQVPRDSELWYSDAGVSFLQEDVKDEADIRYRHAQTIRNLVDAGYVPDAVVDAVTTGNLAGLAGQHSGLYSVQLQKPGTPPPAAPVDTEDDDA